MNLDYLRQELLSLIKQEAVEHAAENEFFKLSNGDLSPYYIDLRKITLNARGLWLACELIDHCWSNFEFDVDAIGGPCLGADPLVGGLLKWHGQHNHHTRGFLVRKESKNHGKSGLIIGSVKPGDHCLLIDDVISSGASIFNAIHALKEFGAEVDYVISIVDRNSGVGELLRRLNVGFHSLYTLEDLELE